MPHVVFIIVVAFFELHPVLLQRRKWSTYKLCHGYCIE